MRVVLHPEAEREFTDAALHYEQQRPGLGADFIDATTEAFADVTQFPHRWKTAGRTIRRGLLRRFPYAFYYREKVPGEEIEVLSICHAKREPSYWIGRFL